MSFRSRSCRVAVFTVALGTLNQQQGHQHPGGKLGDSSENVRRRWGHYEYRILRPVMSDREGIGEWLAGNCRLSSIVLTHISRAPRTSHVTRTARVLSYQCCSCHCVVIDTRNLVTFARDSSHDSVI